MDSNRLRPFLLGQTWIKASLNLVEVELILTNEGSEEGVWINRQAFRFGLESEKGSNGKSDQMIGR